MPADLVTTVLAADDGKTATERWIYAGISIALALLLAFVVDRLLSKRGEQMANAVVRGELSAATSTRLRFVRRLVYAVIILIGVALALALANVAAFAAGAQVPGQGPGAGGLVFVAVMLLAAWGMWRRRYWAVLGFAALMALIAVVFTLLLLIASNVLAVLVCLAFAGSAGWLFWKLIRVMARLQAPRERAEA
jgi:MFS family permease